MNQPNESTEVERAKAMFDSWAEQTSLVDDTLFFRRVIPDSLNWQEWYEWREEFIKDPRAAQRTKSLRETEWESVAQTLVEEHCADTVPVVTSAQLCMSAGISYAQAAQDALDAWGELVPVRLSALSLAKANVILKSKIQLECGECAHEWSPTMDDDLYNRWPRLKEDWFCCPKGCNKPDDN